MRFARSVALIPGAASLINAIQLVPRGETAPAVLALDTERKPYQTTSPVKRDQLRKRQNLLSATLDNEGTLYFVNVTLGSNSQPLRLDIDTGSSDLWTNSATSQLCRQYSSQCAVSGTYTANSSSTYRYVNSAFYIRYADGSYAIGDYGLDTLRIGGQSIANMQFGIGYNSTSVQGILGIGYTTNEASISTIGKTYNNLPVLLKNSGVTNSMAYSLWLNDLSANTGTVLFGGVDSAKYSGTLSTLPIIKESGAYREFVIALTGLTAAGQTILNSAIPVLLDSGSSLSYLPDTYAQALFRVFNAQYDSSSGAAVVSCNLASSTQTLVFNFSGVQISVDMSELVIVDGYRRGVPVCILGISSAGSSSTSVLGDTFLRSAYVVYDLTNNQISLAQTRFNATSSNVQEIASSGTLPGASVVANPVSTLAVGTGGGRFGLPSVTALGSAAKATAMPYGKFAAAAAAGLAFAL